MHRRELEMLCAVLNADILEIYDVLKAKTCKGRVGNLSHIYM